MTLVDTSVWIDHLRTGNDGLAALLDSNLVLIHPFIIGEIACGNLRNREYVLSLLQALPPSVQARDNEVLVLVQNRRLYGSGVGWIDVHLIASALLSDAALWTLDQRLGDAAREAGVRTQ